jgi:hypothetical protein
MVFNPSFPPDSDITANTGSFTVDTIFNPSPTAGRLFYSRVEFSILYCVVSDRDLAELEL